jgi:hypothetical protein
LTGRFASDSLFSILTTSLPEYAKMRTLRLSILAALGLALVSGCGSSSTTAPAPGAGSSGARTEKSPDDRARELIVQLGKVPDNDRAQTKEIAMELWALKSQLSEPLRKDVEVLLHNATFTVTAHESESRRATASDRAAQEEFLEERARTANDNNVPTAKASEAKRPSPAPDPIEVLPQPREVK